MDEERRNSTAPLTAADDVTVDGPLQSISGATGASLASGPRVSLVRGSGPALSGETACLLRYRLRIASLSLCAGFGTFLIWQLLGWRVIGHVNGYVLSAQLAVTIILGAIGASVCRRKEMRTWVLRFDELLVFGLPAAFILFAQGVTASDCATQHKVIPSFAAPWFMLIFTYALFIPNTWRRAAAVIGPMAAAPVVMLMVLWWGDPACGAVLGKDWMVAATMTLGMSIGGTIAVVGVHTIGSLRRQAFEARRLGQYQLRHLIGSGGMGEVYLAEHQLMKRPCAIKIIRPEKAGDPRVLRRFEREVRASAKLSHWNNIDIFDYGRTKDGTFYYVMEFLPGMNLHELVERFGPLPPERVIYLLRQTCDALAEAHGIGLIHRDIKPANIFAAYRGGIYDVAKLLDFGLAKPVSTMESVQLTIEGSITGSPQFMSPEQATGDDEPDGRSDIYSLGAVAYFLLTGQPPFNDTRPIKVLLAHAQTPVQPPSQLRADLPEDLEQVVLQCLEKSPDRRFQSVQDLDAALAECERPAPWDRQKAADWWRQNEDALPTPQPAVV